MGNDRWKTRLVALFAALLLFFPPHIHAQIAKGYALVIGISGYPNYPSEMQVHYGDKDAEAFADFIGTAPGGGFRTTLLTNEHARRSDILQAIKSIGKDAKSNDIVYIFFAGHGAVDGYDQAYFMPYDGDSKFPEGLGIRMDEFLADVDKNISSNTVFFIDACHAGAALQPGSGARGDVGVVPKLTEEWTKAFKFRSGNLLSMGLFAASSNEVSWEDSVAGHGLFTEYLIDGMKGAADTNADGKITAQELFRYVDFKVEEESKRRFKQQTPVRSPGWAASFPISLFPSNLKSLPNRSATDESAQGSTEVDKAELSEARAEQRLETVRRERPLLLQFIRAMPKGADLEIHNSGSIPPELWIDWAAKAGVCVDSKRIAFAKPPCAVDLGLVPVSEAYTQQYLYQSMINAFSMRNWKQSGESAYDHFYNSFAKFGGVGDLGEELAEMARRAAGQHEIYQEILFTPPMGKVIEAATQGTPLGDNPDINQLAQVREVLLNTAMTAAVRDDIDEINKAESERDTILNCRSATPDPGCSIRQRFQYQILRAFSPATLFFAQMVLGFEVASADSRFVGIGVAQPEDSYHSLRDFVPQMRMFGYLHSLYPSVRIGIAADQLSAVTSDLTDISHIKDAIEIGDAERISHGTSLEYEQDPENLLKVLKKRNILVIICLTSDDLLLDVKGDDHPFRWYLQRGVPLALSTSDEGVLGTSLTQEFTRAVESYGLSYGELKELARNSLTGSFLPGQSLWSDPYQGTPVKNCQDDILGGPKPSLACSNFTSQSEKAALQWRLEAQFSQFEASF